MTQRVPGFSLRIAARLGGRRVAARLGGRRVAARPAAVRLGVLVLVMASLAGCMPAGSSTQARNISSLYQIFFGAAVVVFVIVAGLVSWSILRYRRPRDAADGDLPPQYHSNRILEVIWTGLPIITVLALFGATMATLSSVQARAPSDALTVRVTAFQWQWEFNYPDSGIVIRGNADENPTLVVPANRTVHVILQSADVNHAFYVPAFLFKMDAIPGHINEFNFTVDQPGTYRGQCAEFCGVYHDRMIFSVKAVSAAEFDTWLSQAKSSQAPGASGAISPLPSQTSVVNTTPSPLPSNSQ